MSERLIIHNGTVVTLGACPTVYENGEVIVEGASIAAVGPAGSYAGPTPDRTLDARGGLIMPGLVNAHMHIYSTFARGMALAGPSPANFMELLRGLWWRLDKALQLEDVEYSALVSLMACAYSGTTTIIDHHASPRATPGSLAAIGRALDRIPLRASLCYEVSDRDGPEALAAGIAENLTWRQACADPASDHTMRHALFGLHAAFTLSQESLAACARAGNEAGLGFHIHAAEDKADQDENIQRFGKRVIQRLADHGILGPRTVCAHCIHVDDSEIDLLADSGSYAVHNPQSNMNNAVGAMALGTLLERGVRVGLGTDGMASDMRQEAAAVSLLQRQARGDPTLGFMETGTLLLEHNTYVGDKTIFEYLPFKSVLKPIPFCICKGYFVVCYLITIRKHLYQRFFFC